MSVNRKVYLITGLNINNALTDKFRDWIDSNEGEAYTEDLAVGKIKIIEDFMCGDYTYLGYIHAVIDDYDGIEPVVLDEQRTREKLETLHKVEDILLELSQGREVIDWDKAQEQKIQHILFTHFY